LQAWGFKDYRLTGEYYKNIFATNGRWKTYNRFSLIPKRSILEQKNFGLMDYPFHLKQEYRPFSVLYFSYKARIIKISIMADELLITKGDIVQLSEVTPEIDALIAYRSTASKRPFYR
jgi:hypothetical protein